MSARGFLLAAVLLLTAGCPAHRPPKPKPPPPLFPSGWTLVDLTRPLDSSAGYTDHEKAYPFEHVPVAATEERDWRTGKYAGLEHQGTHVSSPGTRGKDQPGVADLSLQQLLAEAVVLDVAEDRPADSPAVVTAAEVEAHERIWGEIPRDTIVLLRGGPDGAAGLDAGAFESLLSRGVSAIGSGGIRIDAAGPGQPVEKAAQEAGLWLALGLGDLSELPPRGALVLAGAIPIAGAAGAPARVIALVPPSNRLPKPVPRPATRKAQ